MTWSISKEPSASKVRRVVISPTRSSTTVPSQVPWSSSWAKRYGHGPGLDATVAVEPLLQVHPAHEVVDVPSLGLGHQAADLHGPRGGLEIVDVAPDVLAGGELVEVVVGAGHVLGGERAVEGGEIRVHRRRIPLVRRDRLAVLGAEEGLRIEEVLGLEKPVRDAARDQADGAQTGPPKEPAAVEIDGFVGGLTLGDLPFPARHAGLLSMVAGRIYGLLRCAPPYPLKARPRA